MPSPKESILGLVVYIFWGDFREKDLACWTIVRKATGALARHQNPSKVCPGARVVGRNEASSIVTAQNEVVARFLWKLSMKSMIGVVDQLPCRWLQR